MTHVLDGPHSTTEAWLEATPLDRLERAAAREPSAIAMQEVQGKQVVRSITRMSLARRIRAAMQGLRYHGFTAGDRVLFSVRPGIDATVLVLAVHALGGVLVPQDPGTSDALFAARMALLSPRWVFAESILFAPSRGIVQRLLRWRGIHLAPLGAVPGARLVRVGRRVPGTPPALTLHDLECHGPFTADAAPSPDSDAFIVCTSGTTAAPKAVVHTRRSLAAILQAVDLELAVTAHDIVFTRELHLVLPALGAGARVVVPRAMQFDADRTIESFTAHGVTHAFLVTRDCRLVLEACRERGRCLPDSLRSLMIGAAPVRAGFLAELRDILPAECIAWCVYGATEVLPIARVSLEEKTTWQGTGDLVGAPIPGVTVRVDDDGQLHVRGDRLCRGYAGEPPMREHATGDLARLDDGRIVLLGRIKDMIIRGDHNIYPALYEPLAERIDGVRRAALIGDFDTERADERVILVVEPAAGVNAEALHARVHREVRAGPHRFDAAAIPDRIVVRALPESGRSHKVDKQTLRAMLDARPA